MNKIYQIVFVQFTPSLQSVLKLVSDYEKKSNSGGMGQKYFGPAVLCRS